MDFATRLSPGPQARHHRRRSPRSARQRRSLIRCARCWSGRSDAPATSATSTCCANRSTAASANDHEGCAPAGGAKFSMITRQELPLMAGGPGRGRPSAARWASRCPRALRQQAGWSPPPRRPGTTWSATDDPRCHADPAGPRLLPLIQGTLQARRCWPKRLGHLRTRARCGSRLPLVINPRAHRESAQAASAASPSTPSCSRQRVPICRRVRRAELDLLLIPERDMAPCSGRRSWPRTRWCSSRQGGPGSDGLEAIPIEWPAR